MSLESLSWVGIVLAVETALLLVIAVAFAAWKDGQS